MSLSFLNEAVNEASWLLLVTVLNFSGGSSTRDGSVSTVAVAVPSHEVCASAGAAHRMSIRSGTAGGSLKYVVAWSCHSVPQVPSSPTLMLLTTSGFDGATSTRDGSSASVAISLPEKEGCNAIGNEHRNAILQAVSGGDTTYAVNWSCTPLKQVYSLKQSPLHPDHRAEKRQ
jgi:hypothetical protein